MYKVAVYIHYSFGAKSITVVFNHINATWNNIYYKNMWFVCTVHLIAWLQLKVVQGLNLYYNLMPLLLAWCNWILYVQYVILVF
jgi:hypothetical protein